MKRSRAIATTYCLAMLATLVMAGTVFGQALEFVPVGNPGNPGELSGTIAGNGGGVIGPERVCGAVGYDYNIGKFEVTAGQYVQFLNAVAATDTYGLYSTFMGNTVSSKGCNIQRAGVDGGYTYSVAIDWANRPVNYVSWGDAARFVNWLTNGQPTGAQDATTTEDGSYTLNGATTAAALMAITRNANARYVIPTEDEWYKAAYHKNDGVTGNYWDYPTSSDAAPSNVLTNPDPGNNANYNNGTLGAPYYRTEVGDFENSESPYGTFDQGGNVWEWTETTLDNTYRGIDGGAHNTHLDTLSAMNRRFLSPADEYQHIGFRVAEVGFGVPEPATMSLLALGGLALIQRKRNSQK